MTMTQTLTIDPCIIDTYYGDGVKPSQWKIVADAGLPWVGAILQVCNGTDVAGWFIDSWEPLKEAGGARYGIDWFRGSYGYMRIIPAQTPAQNIAYALRQADAFLSGIEAAGGFGIGDLWPAVDVERAGNSGSIASMVVDATSTWSETILRRTGRRPILYAGSYFKDLGIKDHCGCQMLWFPRWEATLSEADYGAIGWTRDRLWGWQYCGDGNAKLANYPHTTPIGPLDITAIVLGDAAGPQAPLNLTRTRRGVEP